LHAYTPNLEIKFCRNKEDFRREVADAHIILGGFEREDFSAARQLRWIQHTAAGVDDILSLLSKIIAPSLFGRC